MTNHQILILAILAGTAGLFSGIAGAMTWWRLPRFLPAW